MSLAGSSVSADLTCSFIQDKIEEIARHSPESVAAVFDHETLTYGRLNARANQLAHHLQSTGVGSEVLVAICVERSLDMVVGILGILKAGGAFLPLDPTYPLERLDFMLTDANAPVILTQKRIANLLPETGAIVILLDAEEEQINLQSEENPRGETLPDNLAYVIYTSGSTGKPKGSMLVHRGLANLAQALTAAFVIRPDERVLQFASISFDASVAEIFSTLWAGATICFSSRESLVPGAPLLKLMREQGITNVTLPPSVLAVLPEDDIPSLRTVISAGEACFADIVSRWAKGRRFVNAYGPTEATVCATAGECNGGGQKPSIGKAISEVEVCLLDEQLRAAEAGLAGEICIFGKGIGRGYLNRPDLTAERFVPNPLSVEPGGRLYRTGDLARYREDGSIEYLDRVDNQIKIRGFRIEPGEIEEILTRHPSIRDAVVLADGPAGDKRLVAYIVSVEKSGISSESLREYLKKHLPAYMVPSAFVMLAAMPLAPNGKVDRHVLLNSNIVRPVDETFVAPRTEVEEKLAEIWSQVLQVESPGVNEDFYELGGHSLTATQMTPLIQTAFGVEIQLHTLLESPTISQLGLKIENELRTAGRASVLEITQAPKGKALPLSNAQQRMWLSEQMNPGTAIWNLPVVLRIRGRLVINALEQALDEITRRQHSLRTIYELSDGQPVQMISPPVLVPFQIIDLEGLDEVANEALAMRLVQLETQRPFDLGKAPLLRVKQIRLGGDDCLLAITFHHITFDEWSRDLMENELMVLYRSFLQGKPSPLPELTLQYLDFAYCQRQWTERHLLDDQRSYWRRQLAAAPALIDLTDRRKSAAMSLEGEFHQWSLPLSAAQSIKTLANKEAATMFMAILALFKVFLYRQTGHADIIIGTDLANRSRAGTDVIIGFFVNAVALRTKLAGSLSFRQVLRRVRQTALEAYANQELPFEEVLKELPQERTHSPLFNAFLLFQNPDEADFELEGLEVTRLGFKNSTALRDLSLVVKDTPEGIACSWNYKTELFDRDTIERWTASFRALVESVDSYPDLPVDELEFYSAEEKARRDAERHQREENSFNRFKAVRRRPVVQS